MDEVYIILGVLYEFNGLVYLHPARDDLLTAYAHLNRHVARSLSDSAQHIKRKPHAVFEAAPVPVVSGIRLG